MAPGSAYLKHLFSNPENKKQKALANAFILVLLLGAFALVFVVPNLRQNLSTTRAAGTIIYRSVTPGAAGALLVGVASPQLTVQGSAVTFASAVSDSIGLGDAIEYDDDSDGDIDAQDSIIFITGRTNSTTFTAATASGGTPVSTVTSIQTYNMFRAYTSLANAETGTENTGIDADLRNFDTWSGGKDLVTADQEWNIVLYGAVGSLGTNSDAGGVTIDGWTTDSTHTLKIYTPTSTSQVGTTQRHAGTFTTEKYYINNSNNTALTISDDYVRVYGLQIQHAAGGATNHGVLISNISTGANVEVTHNIIKGTDGLGTGIIQNDDNTGAFIINNIVYGTSTGVHIIANSTVNSYVYNNTVYATASTAYNLNNGVSVKNNLCYVSAGSCFSGSGTYTTASNNIASDSSAQGTGSLNGQTSGQIAFTSTSIGSEDLHITSASVANGAGTNLSADGNYPFTNDIDTVARGTVWDVGADEVLDTTNPTASITAPTNGATVTGASVAITATASDNVSVAGVQFKRDGTNIGSEDTSSPYSITWDTTALADGDYDLTAVARDSSDNTGTSATVTVTVDNSPPEALENSAVQITVLGQNSARVQWTTTEASTSVVDYGLTNSYGSNVTDASAVTNHIVTLSSLTAATTYFVRVRSLDTAGNTFTDDNSGNGHSFTTVSAGISSVPTITDTSAPLVSNVSAAPSDTSAVITWITNEEASSLVGYGLDATYPSLAGNPSTFVAVHSVTLIKLKPETTYHYLVISLDSSGNQGTSADLTFTTTALGEGAGEGAGEGEGEGEEEEPAEEPTEQREITLEDVYSEADRLGVGEVIRNASLSFVTKFIQALPQSPFISEIDEQAFIDAINELAPKIVASPIITGAEPQLEIGATFVRVRWVTDKKSNSIVGLAHSDEYRPGLTNPYALELGNINEQVLVHEVYIPNLEPDTLYHYEVKSKSQLGNWTTSGDRIFKTLAISGDISSFRFTRITEKEASIFWSTNVPPASSIQVTDVQTGQSTSQSRASFLRDHEFNIINLRPGATYNLRITSRDESNRTTVSPVFPFTTVLSNLPPQISNVRVITALIPGKVEKVQTIVSWSTDKPATSRIYFEEGVSLAEELEFSTEQDVALVLNHVIVTTQFQPGKVYRFKVESIDSLENVTFSESFTMLTPRPTQTVFDMIVENFEQIFGFLRNVRN